MHVYCFGVVFTSGNFEVGVHIADVSYFVEGGSALDIIASQRATSVYLVQKVSTPQRMFINDALKCSGLRGLTLTSGAGDPHVAAAAV